MACLPHDAGAIIWAPDFKPSKNGVLVSLNCGNEIDEWLKLIVEYGGKITYSSSNEASILTTHR